MGTVLHGQWAARWGPEVVLSRREALSRLESADASPVEALHSLARSGDEEVAERLASRLSELEEQTESFEWWDFKADLRCALLLFAGQREWLELLKRCLAEEVADTEVCGLATIDDHAIPFEDNPWGIEPSAGLLEALQTVWEPLGSRLGAFVPRLYDRCVAVALLEGEVRLRQEGIMMRTDQ